MTEQAEEEVSRSLRRLWDATVDNLPAALLIVAWMYFQINSLTEALVDVRAELRQNTIKLDETGKEVGSAGESVKLLGQKIGFMDTRLTTLETRVGEYGELKYKFGSMNETVEKLEKRLDFIDAHEGAVIRK